MHESRGPACSRGSYRPRGSPLLGAEDELSFARLASVSASARPVVELRRHGRPLRERDYVAKGLGSLHAGTVVKLGWRGDLDRGNGALDLACRGVGGRRRRLAIGGYDALRGIYPSWRRSRPPASGGSTTSTTRGSPGGTRLPPWRGGDAHDDAVLRRARAGDEGPGRLRPQGHRPRRALVALRYADGIAIVAENSSETLRKVSEIYDRIAFAGVGRYNEFDQLRVAGVRAADLKGYQYSRDDVDARSLANQYAQILGQIFTHEMKPMEVEILVAEVGLDPAGDQMFHIQYDGTVDRPARLHGARR